VDRSRKWLCTLGFGASIARLAEISGGSAGAKGVSLSEMSADAGNALEVVNAEVVLSPIADLSDATRIVYGTRITGSRDADHADQ
jgi:hypothetical protein